MYRKLAEIAGQYLKKGSQVYLEGKIQSRKYTDKNGAERTAYDIIANEMKMLGGNSQATQEQLKREQATAAPVEDITDDVPF